MAAGVQRASGTQASATRRRQRERTMSPKTRCTTTGMAAHSALHRRYASTAMTMRVMWSTLYSSATTAAHNTRPRGNHHQDNNGIRKSDAEAAHGSGNEAAHDCPLTAALAQALAPATTLLTRPDEHRDARAGIDVKRRLASGGADEGPVHHDGVHEAEPEACSRTAWRVAWARHECADGRGAGGGRASAGSGTLPAPLRHGSLSLSLSRARNNGITHLPRCPLRGH